MEKKIEDLTNLNYRLISFIETILSNEETCIKNGKHIYLKSLFEKEFIDILSKNDTEGDNLQGGSNKNTINIRRVTGNEEMFEENDNTEVIEIDIPESDTEPLNIIKSDEIFPYEMMGGDKKIVKKNVKIDTSKDEIYEIKNESKKKDTKRAKIERRLNRL